MEYVNKKAFWTSKARLRVKDKWTAPDHPSGTLHQINDQIKRDERVISSLFAHTASNFTWALEPVDRYCLDNGYNWVCMFFRLETFKEREARLRRLKTNPRRINKKAA